MKKLNRLFFGDEEIHSHDAWWFYGVNGGIILMTLFVLVVTL